MGATARKRKVEIPRRKVAQLAPRPKQKPEQPFSGELLAVSLVVLGVFLAAALYSFLRANNLSISVDVEGGHAEGLSSKNLMGPLGLWVSEKLTHYLGWCSLVTVLWSFLLARTVWTGGPQQKDATLATILGAMIGSVGLTISSAALTSVLLGFEGGGKIGSSIAWFLIQYVNEAGAFLLSVAVLVLSLGIATGIGTLRIFSLVHGLFVLCRAIFSDTWYFCRRMFHLFAIGRLGIFGLLLSLSKHFLLLIRHFIIALLVLPVRIYCFLFRREFPQWEIKPLFSKEIFSKENRQVALEEDTPFVLGGKNAQPKREKEGRTDKLGLRAKLSSVVPLASEAESPRISRSLVAGEDEKSNLLTAKRKKLRRPTLLSKKGRQRGEQSTKSTSKKDAGQPHFELPPLDLLVSGDSSFSAGPKDEDLIRNSGFVEKALSDFRIGGKVVEVHPGPIITLYQFEPAPGVKVQRIINLADDLALALKVASVRVYAPVPGKGTVGIEVPNTHREIVRLRDILASDEAKDNDSQLAIALGKDTFGQPHLTDLTKMPHLLIAGATGTGKSVCINSIILSLICRNTPDELRFIMIDPKMLELSIYEDIPHLKAPVVTNPKRARGVLWWAVEEMERRYRLMKELGVRHFVNYNRAVSSLPGAKIIAQRGRSSVNKQVVELEEKDVVATATPSGGLGRGTMEDAESENLPTALGLGKKLSDHENLPRIVIVVDELADLMLTVGREIEELLTRLAQKARAAGIHLILATQRPSVNVITGLIKANFPARISFQVASRIDARTVMDTSGAEKLLGQGDMLFLPPGTGRVRRLHSPFVSDKEVVDVVSWLRAQGRPHYDSAIEEMIQKLDEAEQAGIPDLAEGEHDPLYDQAVNIVVEKGSASTSMVQRIFRIGYNRAARILETMERQGVVGPADGAKPRTVLVPNRDLTDS